MKLRNDQIRQVAFIRVGGLGDLLVGTAALVETHRLYPNASVWIVGHREWLELLAPGFWPWCTGIIVLDKMRGTSGTLHIVFDGTWVARETAPLRLFYRRVQAVVNTRYESSRYALGPFLSMVPVRVGSSEWPFRWLYTDWVGQPYRGPAIHEREMILRVIGGKTETAGLPRLKHDDQVNAARVVNRPAKSYWLINPTASVPDKAWPAQRFSELVLRLTAILDKRAIAVLVIGAPQETEWLKKVARDTGAIIQPQKLSDLIDVIASARLLITNASSMQFFAATTNTRTVTLFGAADPLVWGPLGQADLVIRGNTEFPDCHDSSEKERRAYESISVDAVMALLGPLLVE